MIPYFIVFFICFFFTLIDFSTTNKNVKSFLIVGFGLIIILFSGIRWETGTDWGNYISAFNNLENIQTGESGYELLYELLMRFSLSIQSSFSFFLFISAFLIFFLTSFTTLKFSTFPIFSILLLLSYSLNSSGFGYRQDLAIALTFFSFIFVVKRQLFLFLLFVLIASLFHQSAIIFVITYWIYNFNWSKKSIIFSLIVLLILTFLVIKIQDISYFYSDSAAEKVLKYGEMTPEEKLMSDGDPFVIIIRGLINRLFLIIPSLVIFYHYKFIQTLKLKNFIGIFNIVIFSIILFIVISPLGYVFLRFTRYFEIFHILLIPLSISICPKRYKYILIVLYIIYCVFKFSFVLFTDNQIYVPYKSIL